MVAGDRGVEVGVIENIEGLGAELEVEPFGELDVLEERRVPAEVAGADDGAAGFIANSNLSVGTSAKAEVLNHCGELMRSAGIRIADEIRTSSFEGVGIAQAQAAGITRRGAVRCGAGIRVQNSGHLPSAQRMPDEAFLILEERKIVGVVGGEDMAAIVIEVAVLGTDIGRVLRSAVIRGRGTKGVRPGVVEHQQRVLSEVLGEGCLQAVVVRGEDRREEVDRGIALVRANLVELLSIRAGADRPGNAESLEAAEWRLVHIDHADQVTSGAAIVPKIEDRGRGELLLHVHAPHHGVGLLPIRRYAANIGRRQIRRGLHRAGIIQRGIGDGSGRNERRVEGLELLHAVHGGGIEEDPEATTN